MANITVVVNARMRNRWALRLAMWLLTKVAVEVIADGRSLGKAGRFTLTWEDPTDDTGFGEPREASA